MIQLVNVQKCDFIFSILFFPMILDRFFRDWLQKSIICVTHG
jgi:hypothetical protein